MCLVCGNFSEIEYAIKNNDTQFFHNWGHILISIRNPDKWTPLHLVCAYGKLEFAKILIEKGADVNALDQANWTPFMMASIMGFSELAKYLIENGADTQIKDHMGRTMLEILKNLDKGELEVLENNAASDQGITPENMMKGRQMIIEFLENK